MAASLPSPPLLVALFLLLFALLPSSSGSDTTMSAWDQLENNVLPRGLLPASATGYALDEDTHRFEVTLPRTCEVRRGRYLLKYDTIVTGTLDFGSIRELEGFRAKKFFLWYDVTAIEADVGNEVVELQIGALTQTYPESDFEDVPSCERRTAATLRGRPFLQVQ